MTINIIQVIDSLQVGGAQSLLLTFAATVQPLPVKLTLVSLQDNADSPVPNALRDLGVTIHTLPAPRLFDVARVRQLTAVFKQEKYDVVHTHLTYANILGTMAGRFAGIPVMATLHNVVAAKQSKAARRAEQYMLDYAAAQIIAVGHLVAVANRERFSHRQIEVVANAVADTHLSLSSDERNGLRRTLVGDEKRPLLISVGRLTTQKGFPDLLTAFANIRQSIPDAALIIAGTGEDYDALAAQIQTLGLSGHAHLLGRRDDIPQLLAASDVFISSSHWEGLPIAVLEAMSAGLPVVATAVGEIPQLLVDGTGIIIPAKEPKQIETAVTTLLNNPAQRQTMGQAARAHIAAHYSAEAWTQTLLTLSRQAAKLPEVR